MQISSQLMATTLSLPSKGHIALSASGDFRSNATKTLQYFFKLLYACGVGGKTSKDVAKTLSAARRIMTFLRLVKYADDVREARTTHEQPLRTLLYLETALNVTVDAMNDLITLHDLGLLGRLQLPSLGSSWSFERVTNALDSALAAVGTAIGLVKLQAAAASSTIFTKQRIALIAYVGGLLKNLNAAKLNTIPLLGPGDRVAALGGMISAAISANKQVQKCLPPPPKDERLAAREEAAQAAEKRR